MDDALTIHYARGLADLGPLSYDDAVAALCAELPDVWIERYQRMCDGPTGVVSVTESAFEYLFDYCSEVAPEREDRLVVVFGRSRRAEGKRDAARLRGWPGSDARGDRGHFIAHSAGGGLDINLFHQNARLNRGWSDEGRRYRAMEKYVAGHEGTFLFSRPIYSDTSARPSELEYGILRRDLTFWAEVFRNRL